jgi:hypothetical protein
MVCPSAVYVRFSRAGGGPGVYFDFATLSAHVPIRGSSCAHTIPMAAMATTARMVARVKSFPTVFSSNFSFDIAGSKIVCQKR